jgi:hypothetical protein
MRTDAQYALEPEVLTGHSLISYIDILIEKGNLFDENGNLPITEDEYLCLCMARLNENFALLGISE